MTEIPTTKRLKIAYLCDHSPLDPSNYSGGNALIYQALQKHVGDVEILATDWHWLEPLRRLIGRLPVSIIMRLRWRLHLLLGGLINRGRQNELAAGDYDVLFGAYSYHSLYKLKKPAAIISVYTSDATPTTYKQSEIGQSFGSFLSISRLMDPWVERTERVVFSGTDLLIWPSQWVHDASVKLHHLAPERSIVVPWGANIADPGPEETPPKLAQNHTIKLLLIGRNWFAKGGPVAFDTMQNLRAHGFDAHLTVIGCTPPDFHRNDFVTVHPNLDKSDPAQLLTFTNALRAAHFMVMPTFESYGFAMCEASAYGLPVLCWRIGGVPVRNGINGQALPKTAGPEDFTEIIEGYIKDPEKYLNLRKSTYAEYSDHLNWDAWGKAVAKAITIHPRFQHSTNNRPAPA